MLSFSLNMLTPVVQACSIANQRPTPQKAGGKRAGGQALSILASPLNVHILKALGEGPKELIDLRRAVGSPPQSTMRLYSRALGDLGLIRRRGKDGFPRTAAYELRLPGVSMLGVGEVLQGWLQAAPDGPILLGSTASKNVVKALVEGWSANIVRALAIKPLSLTELDQLIAKVSYPSLERRLGTMRLGNLVEPRPGDGRGTPYVMTEWMKRAIIPLAAAAEWERRYLPGETAAIGRLDIEAAFLMAVSLMVLPAGLSGRCRLAVEVQGGTSPVFAGVMLHIEEGKLVSCSTRLEGNPQGWVSGSSATWLSRLSGQDRNSLEIGGDAALAEAVLKSFEDLIPGPGPGRVLL